MLKKKKRRGGGRDNIDGIKAVVRRAGPNNKNFPLGPKPI